MSPVIRISDAIFKRLQKYAKPLVDTPATAIERILDDYENVETNIDEEERGTADSSSNVIELDPMNPEDLTHTKIIRAKFNNIEIGKWNRLVDIAHTEAMKELGSFDALRQISISNISDGVLKDKGFRYLKEIGISIQGENANQTWKSALKLARKINAKIEVQFQWRSNKRTPHPGRIGRIEWNPE